MLQQASFYTRFQSSPELNALSNSENCLALHWIIISLTLVFFLVSTLCMLQAIKEVEWDTN
jgi:hypothetical protein